MPTQKTQAQKPAYRQRPGYAQAIVTLTDAETRAPRLLDQPESRERYHRLIAEWERRGRRLPVHHNRPATS